MPKYVVSSTIKDPDWNNSTVLAGDVVEEVSKLKLQLDGEIVVPASYQLGRTLIEHDLVDELRLVVFPVVLGAGERLFGETSQKKPMRLLETKTIGRRPRPAHLRARPGGLAAGVEREPACRNARMSPPVGRADIPVSTQTAASDKKHVPRRLDPSLAVWSSDDRRLVRAPRDTKPPADEAGSSLALARCAASR